LLKKTTKGEKRLENGWTVKKKAKKNDFYARRVANGEKNELIKGKGKGEGYNLRENSKHCNIFQ